MLVPAGFVGRVGRPTLRFNTGVDILTLAATSVPSYMTFTRASNATFFNSSGVLTTASTDVARFDFNPTTLQPRGLLLEGARTNSVRNGNATGASAGTPGTVPTNWTITNTAGVTREIVGSGTVNGISYVDVRYFGTPSASPQQIQVEASTQIAAANGEVHTATFYMAIVGGSTSGFTSINMRQITRDAGASVLTTYQASSIAGSLTSTMQRFTYTVTVADATAAWIVPVLGFSGTGSAVDITLRIGAVQHESLASFASSYIPTTSAAATRALDNPTTTDAFIVAAKTFVFNFRCNQLPPSGVVQTIFQLDSGADTAATRVSVDISNTGVVTLRGGTGTANLGTYTAATDGKVAISFDGSNIYGSLNGAATVSASSTQAGSFTTMRFGLIAAGTANLFGWLPRATAYLTTFTNPATL